jgi:hypothetical protein
MPEFAFTDGAVRFAEAARAVADAARELGSFREVRAVGSTGTADGQLPCCAVTSEAGFPPRWDSTHSTMS